MADAGRGDEAGQRGSGGLADVDLDGSAGSGPV